MYHPGAVVDEHITDLLGVQAKITGNCSALALIGVGALHENTADAHIYFIFIVDHNGNGITRELSSVGNGA